MKAPFRLMILLPLILGGLSFAPAQDRVPHIDLLTQRYGTVVEQNLVEVRAGGGQPMPATWLFFSRDPVQTGDVVEYTVTEGEVVSARRMKARGDDRDVFDPSQVRISPLQAFQTAERAALEAGVGYHWADYSLLANARTGTPEWQLGLFDGNGELVGAVRLSATSGQMLETRWASPGGQVAQGSGSSPAANGDSAEGTGIGEGAAAIGEGAVEVVRGVGRSIGRGVEGIGRWFQSE